MCFTRFFFRFLIMLELHFLLHFYFKSVDLQLVRESTREKGMENYLLNIRISYFICMILYCFNIDLLLNRNPFKNIHLFFL